MIIIYGSLKPGKRQLAGHGDRWKNIVRMEC
jgi:hypothetical protein